MSGAIEPKVRDSAIHWMVRLQSGVMSTDEQEAFQRWRDANDAHAQAWQQVVSLALPRQPGAELLRDVTARKALESAGPDMQQRRQLLKRMVVLGLLGAATWQSADSTTLRAAFANYQTGTGERRKWTLADGSALWLNTASAVDLEFNPSVRGLRLIEGELSLISAPDARALQLLTADALLRTTDAQFLVRHDRQGTLVTVMKGQVKVQSRRDQTSVPLEAGWQTRVDNAGIETASRADLPVAQAWLRGILPAERMRLDDLVAELSRYRPGVLRCREQVAGLRLTGSFSLDNTDAALTLMARSLPVRIERLTRYWVTVMPA